MKRRPQNTPVLDRLEIEKCEAAAVYEAAIEVRRALDGWWSEGLQKITQEEFDRQVLKLVTQK